MTTARSQLINLDTTAYYHCVSRCVRRSFLCGEDSVSGKSYEHRRSWVERKIYTLASVYCIDICSYAVMSNHYHLVVYIDKQSAQALSPVEVVERWGREHKLPVIIQRWQQKQLIGRAEYEACEAIIERWRARLYDLSWFMKELNYDIACRANQEDECKGHFWESRFKSQALLDETALAAAMAYVDLNPVRAGIADKPETSEFTSIRARLQALEKNQVAAEGLAVFAGNPTNKLLKGIPFRLMDYLELVDWSSRQYREGKGVIEERLPGILDRLSVNQRQWLKASTNLERYRAINVGCNASMESIRRKSHKKRVNGLRLEAL